MKAFRQHTVGLLFILGTLVMPSSVRLHSMNFRTMNLRFQENLYATADAAERSAEQFAQQSPEFGRVYPANTANLVPFLSRPFLLQNPFTLAATEPVDGAAATPGQVGYTVVSIQGWNRGYTLTLFGRVATTAVLRRIYADQDLAK